MFWPRGDCARPYFDQLNVHILECLLFCWRSKMCACSCSKHGRSQSPLGFGRVDLVNFLAAWTSCISSKTIPIAGIFILDTNIHHLKHHHSIPRKEGKCLILFWIIKSILFLAQNNLLYVKAFAAAVTLLCFKCLYYSSQVRNWFLPDNHFHKRPSLHKCCFE